MVTEQVCKTVNDQKCSVTFEKECGGGQEQKCTTVTETVNEEQCQDQNEQVLSSVGDQWNLIVHN